jgi:hypothetical protein
MNGAVYEPMRLIITGVKDGKSCVVEEVDCTPQGADLSTLLVARLPVADLPPRPPGKGEFVEIPVAPGEMIWFRVRFPANQLRRVHHTDTIDCHTVVSGWIELLLDDGAHRLNPGDSAMVTGVDHGWRIGPEGCVVSMRNFGTPKPAD